MKKLLFGTILLTLVIIVPIPMMAAVDISIGISLPPPIEFAVENLLTGAKIHFVFATTTSRLITIVMQSALVVVDKNRPQTNKGWLALPILSVFRGPY